VTHPPLPETLRDGRYRLLEPLGTGGMAVVVRAHDTELDVMRAVKVLLPDMARPSVRRRLQNEARAMARLGHPHILSIHDVGRDGDLDWIVMDLATGGSLQDLVGSDGPLPLQTAIGLMVQVLSALAAAHAAGIVHRDVKPHNVLLDADGRALLADFGIAMLTEDDRTTRTGVAMGSMSFMPPEQRLDAARVGPEADLYACGTTLYAILTDDNPVDLFMAGPDSERWQGVPDAVRAVVQRACAPHPSDRFGDAGALAHALLDVLDALGDEARESVLPSRGFFPAPAASTRGERAPVTKKEVSRATRQVLVDARTWLPAPEQAPSSTQPTAVPQPTSVPPPPSPGRRRLGAGLLGFTVVALVTLGAAGAWMGTPWSDRPAAPGSGEGVGAMEDKPAAAERSPAAGPGSQEGAPNAAPAPAPEVAPEPEPEPEPAPQPPVEPTAQPSSGSPQPGAPGAAPAPAPAPTPAPAVVEEPPDQGAGLPEPLGEWSGSLNGKLTDLSLGGSPGRITGQMTMLHLDGRSVRSQLQGHFDPDTDLLILEDLDGSEIVGTYRVKLGGGALRGSYERTDGRTTTVSFTRP